MSFGKNLELILKNKNMTVIELSRKVKVAPTTIYSLIQRDGNKIDIELFLRICRVLGVRPDIFMEKSDSEELPVSTTVAAHFDGEEYTEDELEEIKKFTEFVKSKRKS